MGGTGRGFRVTLAAATDSRDAQIPEPGPEVEAPMEKPEEGLADEERRKARNGSTATREGKPSKVETHERHQHETRLEGLREEQDVKRLRKPEGVAEPGEEIRRVVDVSGNGDIE